MREVECRWVESVLEAGALRVYTPVVLWWGVSKMELEEDGWDEFVLGSEDGDVYLCVGAVWAKGEVVG